MGAKRSKLDLIGIYKDGYSPVVLTHVNAVVSGNIAVINGIQDEIQRPANEIAHKYLFMRTYVKRQNRWQLIASSQNCVFDADMKILDPDEVYYRSSAASHE